MPDPVLSGSSESNTQPLAIADRLVGESMTLRVARAVGRAWCPSSSWCLRLSKAESSVELRSPVFRRNFAGAGGIEPRLRRRDGGRADDFLPRVCVLVVRMVWSTPLFLTSCRSSGPLRRAGLWRSDFFKSRFVLCLNRMLCRWLCQRRGLVEFLAWESQRAKRLGRKWSGDHQ